MVCTKELRGIGITVFINEYNFFKRIRSKTEVIEYLTSNGISNAAGAKIRYSHAKKIFSDKVLLLSCLNYIVYESKKSSPSLKSKANEYLQEVMMQE